VKKKLEEDDKIIESGYKYVEFEVESKSVHFQLDELISTRWIRKPRKSITTFNTQELIKNWRKRRRTKRRNPIKLTSKNYGITKTRKTNCLQASEKESW